MKLNATHRLIAGLFACSTLVIGCNESSPEPADTPESSITTTTIAQPVVDADAPNWFVGGGEGLSEMVGGTDGEPDTLVGRFALEGNVIFDAAAGSDRWVIAGNGQTQAIDDTALRLADARDVLQGEVVNFISSSPQGFLVGGGNGRAQTLDTFGEPSQNENDFLNGNAIADASWNGLNWVIGGANRVAIAGNTLNSPNAMGLTVSGIADIRAVSAVEDFGGVAAADVWVFGADSAARVTAQGTPQPAQQIEPALSITAVHYVDGRTALGTADGRFGFFTASTASVAQWTNVVGGAAITKIEWSGTEYLALAEGGLAQRIDTDGAPLAAAVQLPTTRAPTAAWFTNNRWLIAIGEIGFVLFRAADLSALRQVDTILDGGDILAADVTDESILVAGGGGRVRLLAHDGTPTGDVNTSTLGVDIHDIAFNGTVFLVVGDGGFAQMVDTDGAFMGNPFNYLGGDDLRFATWSGETWLVGGESGQVQRVRSDGTTASDPLVVADVAELYDARWNGDKWVVVGESTNALATYAFIAQDGTVQRPAAEIAGFDGAAFAVEFTGSEFLVAGSNGNIQRVTNEGSLNGPMIPALNGYDILDIYFNGANYLMGGRFGAVRRLSPDIQPLRVPIAVIDERDVNAIVWTQPRGFAGGFCLSDTACYEGPCVGSLGDGQCCDSACDRTCESCFERDTGEPDGTCAPVVSGKQPPLKPGQTASGCTRQSEATCGLTGVCDGAGECAFYGAEIQCGEPSCSNGDFSAVSTCDGSGACAIPTPMSCAPYVGCNIENGCQTSCAADTDCIEDYVCDKDTTECVSKDSTTPEARPDSGDDDDGGCSSVPGRSSTSPLWLAMIGLGFAALRSRR